MSRKLLSDIINMINLGIIVVDADCKILLWNEWIVKHTGITQATVLGRDLVSVFIEPISPALLKAIKNTFAYGLPTVLSNALHQSPLPLYNPANTTGKKSLISQSITVSALTDQQGKTHCVIQISDATTSLKREKMLRSHSEALKREAVTDGLTGIYNRRYFNDHYTLLLRKAILQRQCLSIFLIDIDHFKQYNDFYGHLLGDDTLITVAQTLKSQLTKTGDVLARYGGEEFVMIFPNFSCDQAKSFAQKLIRVIYDQAIPHLNAPPHYKVTISIGTCTGLSKNEQDLLNKADTALYLAKQKGRNCSISLKLD